MCLAHAVEGIVRHMEAETGASLAKLLDVHESYHVKAFPFAGSYRQLLRQQHSMPFTEYDAILMYRILFYIYDAVSLITISPEQLDETVTPCTLALLSLMLARHVSPTLCALKTFLLSTTHEIFLKSTYQSMADAFLRLLRTPFGTIAQSRAVDVLTDALQETTYAKYVRQYCRRSRHAVCCPVISTAFIDQVFLQFLSTSSPFLSDLLTSDRCSCDRSMTHAFSIVEERCKYRYLDRNRLYLPDISSGASFGPPVSCFSDQSRPGPVRLTWLSVSRTIMGRDDPLYPIVKPPEPCMCVSRSTSQGPACATSVTARVTQLFMDFLSAFCKDSGTPNSTVNTLSFLKYLETIEIKDLCPCVKRDIISAAQLDMLHELDKLLQEGIVSPGTNPTVKRKFTEVAQVFSMLYHDIMTLECRSTAQYSTLSASCNYGSDKALRSSTRTDRPGRTKGISDAASDDDYWASNLTNTRKRKQAYRVFTSAFNADNQAVDLFIKDYSSLKDLVAQGVSKSSALFELLTLVRAQDRAEAPSSTLRERRALASSLYTPYGTTTHGGDSLRYILHLVTSSLYGLASPPPTAHPFYFPTRQLHRFILLSNSASPWILGLVEQIRTKDIQIVRHRVLPSKRMSIYECSRQCSCPLSCMRRCVQFGKRYRLQIFRQRYGYWGLRTLDYIPEGAPVCEYVGDLISENLAERRGAVADMQRCSYLYDIVCVFHYCLPPSERLAHKETRGAYSGSMRLGLNSYGIRGAHVLQEKADSDDSHNRSASDPEASTIYVLDATRAGNEGRYANHRTKDNIMAKRIIWDDDPTTDHFAHPHLYFFATANIKPMEELFLDYMYKDSEDGLIRLKYPWAFDSDPTASVKEEVH